MVDRYCDSVSLIETKQSEVNIKRNRLKCVIYRSQISLFLGTALIIVAVKFDKLYRTK